MAQTAVTQIGKVKEEGGQSGRSGGGKTGRAIGAAIGGIVGGIAGTAGAPGAGTVMGAMGGAATGASVGQEIGDRLSPARQAQGPIARRIDAAGPQLVHSDQSNQLRNSLAALKTQPQEVQDQYAAPLIKAYIQSLAQDNQGTGMA